MMLRWLSADACLGHSRRGPRPGTLPRKRALARARLRSRDALRSGG